ncbi:MAG: sulfotransferase domain-containing protein [Waterburya sp.]
MPKTTTINSVTSNVSVTNVPSKTEASCKQYEQEFVQLSQEINQLQDSLRLKFQELADLKENIIDHKKIKSQINSQARKLNNLRLNLPNFLIIGVQKGGTTWLHENLKRHPQIFLPQGKKELEFFSYYQKKITDHGLSYYLKYFNQFEDLLNKEKPKAIGEATPSYFWTINPSRKWTNPTNKHFNDQIPDSVFNILGSEIKLILCLRDPVERAISAYFHHIKRGRISYKSQRILDVGHQHGIIDMGFYSQHLDVWLKKFSLDNFKVLIYERDIKQNKQRTIEDICSFLRVDHQLFPPATNLNKYHNRGLQYRIESDGVYLISPDSDDRTVVINQDELQQLRKIYRADYLSLQRTLDLDLSEYWKFD